MPKRTDIGSILILGAGPIVIGQACEFDYSGAQACKALVDHAIAEVPSVLASLTKGGLNARLVAARNSSDLACCCRATSNGGPSPSR
jgi:hypothetical protein